MTSYKLNFSDDWLVLFVFSWLQFGVVHCKISKDVEYCMIKNLKQMGRRDVCVLFPIFFFFSFGCSDFPVCLWENFGSFSIYNFFYVIALCKMTLNKVCLSDSRDNLP